ncbi:hypothetical protein JL475_24240 [Streptomyces sp. M2CJ-2]|uniref:hypothetical protein n=1 Tax=Streptomyces sp. M2CJ-2 TaxID=2803948 RepID=UPI0019262CF8|nr:hypothetical protein [Streptomyces sp. M2CJ-2]MBL3669045.1 hypothetical protein [Streptomyces sp. M2CJ-2]
MAERLTFTLAGRDELSRVLNGTADSADRLRLRLAGITADSDGQLRDLQGRFLSVADAERLVADRTGTVQRSMTSLSDEAGKLGDALKANLISLLPAAIPAAAGLTSSAAALAGQLGAVGVAAGAYALALGPQVSAIGEVLEAQEKWDEAVAESGATSQEAIKAQLAYQRQLEKLPQPTREAAVAVGILKDNYQEWSDSLAGDVMAPFTKGVAVANALLPQTTGLVKGASSQFDRLITLVGGAISTPGFDALNSRFTKFTNDTLRNGIDRLTIFLAKLESGQYDGGALSEWWDYAQQAGPVVWDTLENIADALLNVLEAGSGVGVGMLEVVNVLSGIVSAVPPDAIATILQLAIAIKAVKLAAAGAAAGQAALAALGVQIGAMRAAAAGAPGALAGTTAAIGTLSRTAKVAMAGTGIGLLLITLDQLSSSSRKPQPDVDSLTTSLTELGRSGKVSGEALRVYGSDLSDLGLAFQRVIDPEGIDQVQQSIVSFFGMDSTPVQQAKEDVSAFDEALASLVSAGNADLAAAALDNTIAKLEEQGYSTDGLRDKLTAYNDALAGQALEQELAAQSMGLFGEQAQQVQGKLDAQKSSADGLRQSIQALNDVNRQGLSGMIGFEAAIDAASKAAAENAGVLDMQGGQLVLNSEKQRAAATALNDLASKTDEATASARESGASWEEVNGIYERGRQQLIQNAMQMGLTKAEAKALADQILKTPDKTAKLKGNMEDLQAKLADAKQRLKSVPDSRKSKVRAEISDLQRKIKQAEYELSRLQDKTVTVTTRHVVVGDGSAARRSGSHGSQLRSAQGGPIGRYADGGDVVQLIPFGGPVWGPGTSMSDSVPAWLSNGEYVIRASAVDRYGLELFDALNAERFAGGGAAGGGFTYAPTESSTARISLSTVSSWYDKDVQRLKDAWAKLNEALRDQAKKSTAATRRAVAEARKDVAEADRALGLKAGTKASGFSLTGYAKNLDEAVKKSAAWERNLSKIGKRAGADIEETLRGMGESGRALVASLAKASNKQFGEIVKNLRKLAPTAAATLGDFTRQLNATTAGSKKFQDNLLRLAASGHGDLAMQLAGQGDADAMALAAAAVKSPSAAKKASAAVKASSKVLTPEELDAAMLMLGALSRKGATVEDVVKAGVNWPMLVSLAPRYAKQIKGLAGGPSFVKGMKERGITLAQGGLLVGPGTSMSDSIPLWGSHGEYMVKAAAVAKYGTKFMDALNDGKLRIGRPARPGLPAAPAQAVPVAGGDRPSVTYQVYPRKSVIDVEDLRLLQRQEEARQRVGRPG